MYVLCPPPECNSLPLAQTTSLEKKGHVSFLNESWQMHLYFIQGTNEIKDWEKFSIHCNKTRPLGSLRGGESHTVFQKHYVQDRDESGAHGATGY